MESDGVTLNAGGPSPKGLAERRGWLFTSGSCWRRKDHLRKWQAVRVGTLKPAQGQRENI